VTQSNDADILKHIGDLVAEEHQLERKHREGPATVAEAGRLRAIELALDQSWDLLRQRRGRRDAGLDPDQTSTRPVATVEGYQQ
jgi:hypothetical protein